MLRLTGSALILGAALWLQRSFHLRTLLRQRTLRALSGAFLALESAVRLTLTPLPALLRHLSCEPEAAGFFEGVTANLARGKPLASAWEHAAKTLPIAARERETVSALGHALGGDEESVCAALTLAASELSRLEEKLRQRERETGPHHGGAVPRRRGNALYSAAITLLKRINALHKEDVYGY